MRRTRRGLPETAYGEASTSSSVPSKSSRHRSRKKPDMPPSNLPGVQKLKASLRQTRRLLAKENLAPDVRVSAERRLKSLEIDLAQAMVSRKERTIAVRYHKVKFFERQKVTRKIAQIKKQLASESLQGSDASTSAYKELQNTLEDLRVDLNYITHYPKTRKYISLFPPEVRQRKPPPENKDREEMRALIRNQMEAGQLPTQPEAVGGSQRQPKRKHDKEARSLGVPSTEKSQHVPSTKENRGNGLEEDEFFGIDDEFMRSDAAETGDEMSEEED